MRTTSVLSLLAAVSLLSGAALFAAEGVKKEGPPQYKGFLATQVKQVDKAPEVDGKLDDAAWKDAPVLILACSDGSAAKANHGTEVRMFSTKEALYLGVRCRETDLASTKSGKYNRDADEVWQEDAVEFFLALTDQDDSTYHQIVVNAGGSLYDGFNRDTEWNGANIKAAVGKEEAAWTLELCVPFTDLKLPEDKASLAKGCRMNVYRGRPARGDEAAEDYAWAPTGGGSNHQSNKFGYVFFEAFGAKLPPPEQPAEAKTAAPAEK